MKDLYNAIDALNNIVNENKELLNEKDGDGIKNAPKVPSYKSFGDMVSAIKLPGKQGVADPNQSRANIQKAQAAQAKPQPAAPKPKPAAFTGRPDDAQKPAAPKINPAVPAAGPVRKNPINPQAQAVAKAATSVASAPKQAAVPVPKAKPAAVPVPKAKPAPPAAQAKPQGGDRVTYQSLAKASGIADPNKIKPGQEIKLPGGGTYKVKSGDTLSGIAQNVRLGKVGTPKPATKPAPKPATKPAPDMTNRATSQGGRTAQQAADTYAGGNVQGGEFGTGPVKAQQAATNIATTGSVQGGAPAQPGPSISDVTAAGNARFGDPMQTAMQKARDKRDAAQAEPTQTKPVGSMLDRITGGISDLFGGGKDKDATSPLQGSGNKIPASVQKKIDARRADIANRYEPDADGNYSLSNPPRQPGTSFRASDGTNTVARDASGNLNVRQTVTDPEAQQALLNRVERAREMQRLALAAGSTDPDDIRAYVNRMNRTQGTGAAGGTDPNTF